MWSADRRTFLANLSRGVLAAGIGGGVARTAWGWGLDDDREPLAFGELEALAALMQETPAPRLQELLIVELKSGVGLGQLVAAGALANARTFGGHDYTGYHCMMAMLPALRMSRELPEREAPLPALKVLYRSAVRIQEQGGRAQEALRAAPTPADKTPADQQAARRELREAFLARDIERAELAFGALSQGEPSEAFDEVQALLHENLDVHRVVLAWRAWETLEVTGPRYAPTLLRQSLRYFIDAEQNRVQRGQPIPELRTLLPELLEHEGLREGASGKRRLSDEELRELSHLVFSSAKPDAAQAVAHWLAEGAAPEDVGEALSVAANRLLLQDPGRTQGTTPDKPRGSVHGASVGLHASDAARAWRNISRVSSARNAVANLIAGAYHTAGQSEYVGPAVLAYRERLDEVRSTEPAELLADLRDAIRAGDQIGACALTQRYCDLRHAERPLFDVFLQFAVSEDGALHAEKYYQTVCEEFREARPALRSTHAVALARVTASEFGHPAPGVLAARELLGL